jgi:hypothetical protein
MARDLSEAVEILKEHGLDFAQIVRDTNSETMLRIGSLMDESLELILRTHALKKDGKDLDDKVFKPWGKLHSLADKIKKVKDIGLLDEATHNDAELLRKIRNEFGHPTTKVNFDSPEIVAIASQLSTYEAAETNQAAIFAATDKVLDQVKSALKELKPAAQA